MKLNLGSGKDYRHGYINVDQSRIFKADVYHNLELPWPWPDDSVSEIYCSHILEHIHNIVLFFNEAYRVLKPSGTMEIIVPHYLHPWAYGDPSHVRFLSEESIYPFSIHADHFRHLGIKCNFNLELNQTLIDNSRNIPGQLHWILRK